MALGATSRLLMHLVLGRSLQLALVGAGIGLAAALTVTRLLAVHLTFLNTFDILAFGCVFLLVIGASLVATCLPARGVARVNPIVALRRD
jgi:ABC-type antimicrobial peptide transport system permease subunit